MDLRDELQASLGSGYTLDREIGGGGMSRLFIADDVTLNRKVVVKLLPPALAGGVGVERFRREMMVIARLQHPHIVPVLGTGGTGDALWYIMPFIQGESLRHRLERDGALPIDEALALLRELADALAYAHRTGIVHRDIKPANVLLSAGHAVLADFGIAHTRGPATTDSTDLTATGIGLGTPRYMAPEQFMGASQVDARADIYALGVLAYEMLTGRAPFEGRSAAELLVAHVRETPVPPRKLRSEIPPRVNVAIMRALAKAPEDRYGSAEEFRDAIQSSAPRRRMHWGRNQRIAAIATLGALAIAAVWRLPTGKGAATNIPDEEVLAIAPFTVLAPQMQMWSAGMVDVLARTLDGWGPLRVVPQSALGNAAAAIDARSAEQLARSAKANIVVYGTLYQSGPDSVRAAVSIYDASAGQTFDIERRDESTRMARLADSLTTAILGVLGSAHASSYLPRADVLGTSSLPAMKEYLAGVRLSRLASFDSAANHFQHAVQIDSGFALAWHGLGRSESWGQSAREAYDALLRAGALNHGRTPRDSLLLLADSAWGAMAQPPGLVMPALAARLFDALESVTRRYPNDAEGWLMLGDARVHFDFAAPIAPTPLETLNAFDRAIANDQGYVTPYLHAVAMALAANDTGRARSYARHIVEHGTGPYAHGASEFLALTDRQRSDASLREFVRSTEPRDPWFSDLFRVVGATFVDSAATIARLMRAAVDVPVDRDGLSTAPYQEMLYDELERHGQMRAAVGWRHEQRAIGLARLGILNGDSLSHALAAEYLARDSTGTTFDAVPFWAEHGDSLAILRFIARLPTRLARPAYRNQRRASLALAVASLALARHDSARALAILDTFPPTAFWIRHRTQLRGRLLLAKDPTRGARLLSSSAWSDDEGTETESMEVLLVAARAAERAGDRVLARLCYTRLAAGWAHADPMFKPYVDEVNRALARVRE